MGYTCLKSICSELFFRQIEGVWESGREGRATLQYHLLDGVAWGLRFSTLELQFLRCKVYCWLFSLILLITARYNELVLIQTSWATRNVRITGPGVFAIQGVVYLASAKELITAHGQNDVMCSWPLTYLVQTGACFFLERWRLFCYFVKRFYQKWVNLTLDCQFYE